MLKPKPSRRYAAQLMVTSYIVHITLEYQVYHDNNTRTTDGIQALVSASKQTAVVHVVSLPSEVSQPRMSSESRLKDARCNAYEKWSFGVQPDGQLFDSHIIGT